MKVCDPFTSNSPLVPRCSICELNAYCTWYTICLEQWHF